MDLSSIEVDQPDNQYITVGLICGDSDYKHYYQKDFTKYDSFKKALEPALNYEPDILVGPEYSFVPNKPLTIEERDNLFLELRDMSAGHDTLFLPGTCFWQEKKHLFNTLPVYHSGELIYLYDKVKDGGERSSAVVYELSFKQGLLPGVFSYKGLDIGVEICADHLDKTVLQKHNVSDLDLEIISSCGMSAHHERNTTHKGGYQILSDGNTPKTTVLKNLGPTFNQYEITEKINLNDDIELHLYQIDKQGFNPDLDVEEQIPEAYWERHGGKENFKFLFEKELCSHIKC